MVLRHCSADDQRAFVAFGTGKVGNGALLLGLVGKGDKAKAAGHAVVAEDDLCRGYFVAFENVEQVLVNGLVRKVADVDDGRAGRAGRAGTTL